MSKKNQAIKLHKLSVLCSIMIDTIDDIGIENDNISSIKSNLVEIEKFSEEVLESSFNVKNIKNSTYLQEITNKVNTVMRKNYKEI